MKFSRHLSSHLTPEWRKQYIQYTELKKLVYGVVGSKKSTILRIRPHNREEVDEDVAVVVDEILQDEFFKTISNQLQSINQFFKKEESRLEFSLSELEDQIHQMADQTVRKVRKQRQVLKRALSELYLNLVLLQNYQQLNHTGFRKILKKHDKLTRSSRGKTVFQEDVSRAYFWTSKTVTDMLVQAEKIMIQTLEQGDRSKAMRRLRVPPLGTEKSSHWTSCTTGLFCGIFLLSIVVVCIAFAMWPSEHYSNQPHLEPTLRAMRAGLVLTLWFFGFAINTYGWRKAGVNHVLIFEFDPRNYLGFMELFAVAGMVSVIWMIGIYLIAFAPWLHIPVYVGPLVMYGLLLCVLCLPLPVLHYRSRLWLLKTLGRIACAPFFAVTFADFWLADQLTSLSLAMLDTEYFFCYLFYGIRAPAEGAVISCDTGSYGLRVMVAALPAWWRFAQCLRRYYDTRDVNPHLINAGKYSTSFFVVIFSSVASTLIDNEVSLGDQSRVYLIFFSLWVFSAVISTSYTFSWDILMDWSLFPNIPQRCCHKDALTLRQDTIYSYKLFYMLGLVEDFFFRILWMFNLSVGHHVLSLVKDDIIATVAGIVEVVRRIVWNFFRVENEHVNNVGQFRAVRDISLYPVDLSKQTEQEVNDESSDGPSKRRLTCKLSNDLQEVGESGPIRRSRPRRSSVSSPLRVSIAMETNENSPQVPHIIERPLQDTSSSSASTLSSPHHTGSECCDRPNIETIS